MRRLVFALAALALPLALTLAATEGLLRVIDYPPENFSPWIADPATGFRFAPEISERMVRSEFDVSIETNAEGFRDDPLVPKTARERVLLLGDSFTAGYGVERGELFADLLEERLDIEVINAAVGGWELVHQLHFFRDRGLRYQADRVVYALYLGNDITRNGEWEERDGNVLVSLTRSFPLRRTRSAKLPALLRNARYGLRKKQAEARGEWIPFPDYLAACRTPLQAEGERYFKQAEGYLKALVQEVDRAGLPLSVVVFPFRTVVEPDAAVRLAESIPDFQAHYDLEQPARRIGVLLGRLSAASRSGLNFVDATPTIAAEIAAGAQLYFSADGHFTPAGHRVLAGVVGGLLAETPPEGR